MARELAIIEPDGGDGLHEFTPANARRWLEHGKPLVAPLVLRPFLDAYHLVADRLAAWEGEEVDEPRFLDECLRVGRQWALQGRLASEESVSLELFKPALQLARHRDLLDPSAPQLAQRRADFRDELRETVRRVTVVAELARQKP
jgi:glycerol-3-phosphate O-acyltransferase